jgi:hypothetical protein
MPVLHKQVRGFENTNMLTNLKTVTLFHCRSRVERQEAPTSFAACHCAAAAALTVCHSVEPVAARHAATRRHNHFAHVAARRRGHAAESANRVFVASGMQRVYQLFTNVFTCCFHLVPTRWGLLRNIPHLADGA